MQVPLNKGRFIRAVAESLEMIECNPNKKVVVGTRFVLTEAFSQLNRLQPPAR